MNGTSNTQLTDDERRRIWDERAEGLVCLFKAFFAAAFSIAAFLSVPQTWGSVPWLIEVFVLFVALWLAGIALGLVRQAIVHLKVRRG